MATKKPDSRVWVVKVDKGFPSLPGVYVFTDPTQYVPFIADMLGVDGTELFGACNAKRGILSYEESGVHRKWVSSGGVTVTLYFSKIYSE